MVTRCPRCEIEILHSELASNALSRKDNETYVCSPCGREEALIATQSAQAVVCANTFKWNIWDLAKQPHPEWPITPKWERII